jgi:alcohol dehydrogenase
MFIESGDDFHFFLPPYIVFGRGKRSTIPEYAKKLGFTKALIVLDPFFVGTQFFAETQNALEINDISVIKWSGVVPDPTDVSVDDAVGIYQANNCDGIICIGGGSAIDTGKSVSVVIGSGSHSIREHMAPTYKSIRGMVPVICLPTTSGTGAEVNPYSMVTNTETGQKGLGYPAWEMIVAQNMAIVDPDLTASMPPRLTAITGIDALCQAIECYITQTPNPVSDCLAMRAIYLIAHSLRRAVENGSDMSARVEMSLAAMLATMAFPNAGLSFPHFLSESMADLYHLEHGVAVGSVLIATLEVMLPSKAERLVEIAKAFGISSQGLSQREIAQEGIDQIRQLLVDIRFPSLSKTIGGIDVIDIDAFVADVARKKSQVIRTPRDQELVRSIVKRSLEF